MKRGIIRIIAGSILIIMQIISIIVSDPVDYYYYYYSNAIYNFIYNFAFYIIGIVGITLLIFGINAYKYGFRSQLILHTRSRKLHTVIKWAAFVITTLLFVLYLVTLVNSIYHSKTYILLMLFATLTFGLYLLFYLYKKPSCLFSSSLIFVGTAYIYEITTILDLDNEATMICLLLIPKLIAGVLYIAVASKFYKENFSVQSIKMMGLITFVMEILSRVLYYILLDPKLFFYYYFYYYNLPEFIFILIVIALFLYISVFEINTLEKQTIEKETYVVKFCRKCGYELVNGSEFCNQCGTKIINSESGSVEIDEN